MRLIDADALEKKLHEFALDEWNQRETTSWSNAFLECEDIVYNAQTVESEPVVRCKDCWYYATGWCRKWLEWSDDDKGFCSWGERNDEVD